MMNLAVVASLLIVVAISIEPVQGARRCWCDARVNGKNIKSFGVIARCGGWCGCGNNAINRCGLTCDEKVQKWAETVCLKPYQGQQVRSHFKASSCKTGDGQRTYTCKHCSKKITKRVSYTCYKVVTETVPFPCAASPKISSGSSNPRIPFTGIDTLSPSGPIDLPRRDAIRERAPIGPDSILEVAE